MSARMAVAAAVAAATAGGCATSTMQGEAHRLVAPCEAEHRLVGEAGVVPRACASEGEAVELGAASFELAGADGVLWLRLACDGSSGGATLAIAVDGGPEREVAIASTLHRERFEWVEAGAVPARSGGEPALRTIAIARRGGDRVAVDQLALLRPEEWPNPAAGPAVHRSRDGSLELRAADGAVLFDPAWILQLLREQRDVVDAMLGERLVRPVVAIALPVTRWPRDRAGAFQNGCAIFLRDDELHLPWRSYAHELVHLHEEELRLGIGRPDGRRLALPWFLSEGSACAIALEVEERILGRAGPVGAKQDALARLLADGDEWYRPGSGASNELLALDEDPEDPDRRAAAYAWATAVVREAAIAGGEGSWSRLQSLLRKEASTASGDAPRLSSSRAAELLESAAGRPLTELFARAGLREPDPSAP